MPGLNQLKKFTNDIKKVGDEEKIRAQRGEKPAIVPLPEGISEEDDSQDFVLGMPDTSSQDTDAEEVATDVAPVDDSQTPAAFGEENSPAETEGAPDLEALLNPVGLDLGSENPDLSEFLDEKPSPEEKEEIPLEDMDLSALLAPPPTEETPEPTDDFAIAEDLNKDASDVSDFSTPEEFAVEEPLATDDFSTDALATDDIAKGLSDFGDIADFGTGDFDKGITDRGRGDFEQDKSIGSLDDVNQPDDDFAYSGAAIDLNEDVPDEISDADGVMPEPPAFDSIPSPESLGEPPFGEIDDLPLSSSPTEESPVAEETDSMGLSQDTTPSKLLGSDFDLPDFDLEPSAPVDASADVLPEDFSEALEGISDAGDIDFGEMLNSSSPLGEDEFPVTLSKSAGDDFLLDENDFEIPGFSDTETAAFDKKGRPAVDIADFSKSSSGKPKNSLTEEEYKVFRKNFADYPLNLRLAIEDLIVKNEFTDEAVYEVIEKVLKKVPARQIATHLEKMLDISIDVPRDYERRSYAQYEAYKQSFQYQLKNRIIPGGILATVVAVLCYLLFQAGVMFIYKPTMARMLYRQGYTLLQNSEYPQSETVFASAVKYKPIKKWFYKYAHAYREHKQFERAGQMYKNILGIFNHDKKAGLEWAEMELYDRANYERAEEIVRREILDYHINDASALLLLGDIFLEWGEVSPTKYDDARTYYSDLIQLYGATDLYLSRMLRYFIRTDKLKNVLELKNRFYPREKSLEGDDWVELSGYVLEKLYGNLPRSDEYLRSRIEDVRAMLEIALKKAPRNPASHYNMAKYFNRNNNFDSAKRELTYALDCFDALEKRTKKITYQEIDACRILGGLYADTREYLKAQEIYTRGIDLFQRERDRTGLEGDKNTGRLYAAMGDIEYFISGDMDAALNDYEQAILNKNDTASLNFRVGAIRYNNNQYDKALASFLRANETEDSDVNLLLSIANVLSIRGDNFAAQGYYSRLLSLLDTEKSRHLMLFPQERDDDNRLVEMFLKVNNNLGVTLYRIARQTGDSRKNAESLVRLSDSIRAWDALTRNPKTMVRLGGSNLALQNSKYITNSRSNYEPAIYTDIPKTLTSEKILE